MEAAGVSGEAGVGETGSAGERAGGVSGAGGLSGAAEGVGEQALRVGWRAPEVEQELPQLRLILARARVTRAGAVNGRSPPGVRQRVHECANRYRGARAIGVRREPVPSAYRVFYRQIGLDPEVVRTPIEAVVLERMMHGGFRSEGLLADALLIALIDTGVPVWALDAAALDGELGVRLSRAGEPLGRAPDAPMLPAGRLVVADRLGPGAGLGPGDGPDGAEGSVVLGSLFGELAPDCRPGAHTQELELFAVQVAGVPTLYVEEALWSSRAILEQGYSPSEKHW